MRKASGHVPLRMCYGGGSSGLVLNRISERLLGTRVGSTPFRQSERGSAARGHEAVARGCRGGDVHPVDDYAIDERNYYEDEW